jgi:cobalamin biosynthetic protein CobC
LNTVAACCGRCAVRIARERWLDLSSGIAPWPCRAADSCEAWARLPETEDGLEQAARTYYQPIRCRWPVPRRRSRPCRAARAGRVGVLTPCYAEHPHAWQRAGHTLVELADDQVDDALDSLDVLVLVNPNNPTGRLIPVSAAGWHARLAARRLAGGG